MIELRPFQKTALYHLSCSDNSQSHVLCIAPTGSGKSLIYERAAAEAQRRTILITPLVALARQQFQKLRNLNIPVVLGAGNPGNTPLPRGSGAWIISPEMLQSASKQHILREWKPNLLVVDECHCLWEWGEKFRPSFGLIPRLIEDYRIQKSLWLTATLPFEARLSLRKALSHPLTEMGEFSLPKGLRFIVRKVDWKDRTQALLRWIFHRSGESDYGLIFVPTREATQRLSRLIEATGISVVTYHGGMSSEERKNIEIQVSKKIPKIIVATSAFGMGMDYSHLNYVILWQAPMSLLSLVQTIGRVGRNLNQGGHALVFWDLEDLRMLEWTIQNSEKRRREIEDLLHFFQTSSCRESYLKKYFDQTQSEYHCGKCDYCLDLASLDNLGDLEESR